MTDAGRSKGGRPSTGHTVRPVTLTLPIETLDALRAEAARQGVPMSRIVAVAVERLVADDVEVARSRPPEAGAARRGARAVKLLRQAIAELEGDE